MKRLIVATAIATLGLPVSAQSTKTNYANQHDEALAGVFEMREADWRNGAIVYQVLVDRFAPPANLDAKRALYPAPKKLHGWNETPRRGIYLQKENVWSHEIDFWGGDLASTMSKLDYLHNDIGADVLYLNPIHLGWTSHKYDSLDFLAVSPEFGTRDDVKKLAAETKRRNMKLVLDGVFNHMGRQSERFRNAETNPNAPNRDWFLFGPQFPGGVRSWWGAVNLPELNLENPKVRDYIWGAHDSVLRSYLRDGADGWRLDVAYDIGFNYLAELRKAAHAEKPGSLIVGELPNYPKEWLANSVDGVMNFTLMEVIHRLARQRLSARSASAIVDRMVAEIGIEPLLKSWLMLNNHDSPRLATLQPDPAQRRIAKLLQFTLPGAPNLYYGDEVGMTGGEDPEMRAPMRWDLVARGHPELAWTKQLVALRKANRALRVGEYRPVTAEKLFAFERHTDRVADTVVVITNPTAETVKETVLVANSKLMGGWKLVDQITGKQLEVLFGLLEPTLAPGEVLVLKPELSFDNGYSAYKRVQ